MSLIKRIYLSGRNRVVRYPNQHLSAETARIRKIPFSSRRVYLRPSASDQARLQEYLAHIYFGSGYLHEKILELTNVTLVDLGGNIGMASLRLVEEFPGIRSVLAVEAEYENFLMLQKNFELWTGEGVNFTSLNKIVCSGEGAFAKGSLHDKNSKLTSSGTFTFKPATGSNSKGRSEELQTNTVNISDLVADIDGPIFLKIDIEGGEEYLFEEDSWLEKVCFIATEIHDRYSPDLINSSSAMIRSLVNHDFAIHPTQDMLFCYKRALFDD